MEPTTHRHPSHPPGLTPRRRRRPAGGDSAHEIALRASRDAGGEVVVEEIPLTLEILLNPREEDQVTQGNPHYRFLYPLALRLQRFLERRPGWGVFSDVLVQWAKKDLRSAAPDVTVAEGVADPEAVGDSLDVAAEGCRVRTVFEVVSTSSKDRRAKDEKHNKELFAAAGVDDYVLLYPARHRKPDDRPVRVFTLEAGAYREQEADAEGRFLLASLGLRLSPGDADEPVLEEVTTGERILSLEDEQERRRLAERQAEAANRRLAELLIAVLEERGLTLDARARRRILGCGDLRELERWVGHAFTVASVDDLWNE